MRFRLLDRITACERGRRIAGVLAVGFEAAILLEPLGRDGVLPESLALQAAAELGFWAEAEASGFARAALLESVEGFAVARAPGHAELVSVELVAEGGGAWRCLLRGDRGAAAEGRLRFAAVPLAGLDDPARAAEDWEVLRGLPAGGS